MKAEDVARIFFLGIRDAVDKSQDFRGAVIAGGQAVLDAMAAEHIARAAEASPYVWTSAMDPRPRALIPGKIEKGGLNTFPSQVVNRPPPPAPSNPPPTKPVYCEATQFSDQMRCERCDLTWDTNDGDTPQCRQGK